MRLKRKTNQENKQTNNIKKNKIPSQPNPFSERFFTSSLPGSIFKIYLASTSHLCYGTMLFIICHFFVKAIVFFELVKAVSVSILFTFQISAMRLFILMGFFSLDTYNLSINRMWLLKNLIVFKNGVVVCELRNSKMAVCGVKVGKINLFWKHWSKSDHKHLARSHSWNIW